MAKSDLSAERVRAVLNYDSETGIFRWKIGMGHQIAGRIAGSLHCHGYILICIDYAKYPAHRLAWAHYYGAWPRMALDHIDECKSNNKIANLRE